MRFDRVSSENHSRLQQQLPVRGQSDLNYIRQPRCDPCVAFVTGAPQKVASIKPAESAGHHISLETASSLRNSQRIAGRGIFFALYRLFAPWYLLSCSPAGHIGLKALATAYQQ